MTTVSSTLKMFDSMTGPLKNITNALNIVISTMEQMQRATNRNANIDRQLAAAKTKLHLLKAGLLKRSKILQGGKIDLMIPCEGVKGRQDDWPGRSRGCCCISYVSWRSATRRRDDWRGDETARDAEHLYLPIRQRELR